MIAFHAQLYGPVALSKVQAGDVFYFREMGRLTLAVAVNVGDESKRVWLRLDGPKAFLFEEAKAGANKTVLMLPVDDQRMRIRIDFSSFANTAAEQHAIGQLCAGPEDSMWILGAWEGDDEEARLSYRQAVQLEGWRYSANYHPTFQFDRWSLSYVDEAGQWVDLMTRSPVLGE